MHLTHKPASRPPATAWPDTHLYCEWSSYETHTIFLCPSALRCCSFLCGFDRLSWVTMPWLCPLFCGLGAPFPYFWFTDPKSRFFCLNFYSILAAYRYVVPSEEMSRNSISSWMYMCRQLRYFSTRCFFESLIPNFVRRVWNIFVNSCISWSLCCRNIVHCIYLSSRSEGVV